MVEVGDYQIKYGVIQIDHLISDLMEWNTLYVAGRMQKALLIGLMLGCDFEG